MASVFPSYDSVMNPTKTKAPAKTKSLWPSFESTVKLASPKPAAPADAVNHPYNPLNPNNVINTPFPKLNPIMNVVDNVVRPIKTFFTPKPGDKSIIQKAAEDQAAAKQKKLDSRFVFPVGPSADESISIKTKSEALNASATEINNQKTALDALGKSMNKQDQGQIDNYNSKVTILNQNAQQFKQDYEVFAGEYDTYHEKYKQTLVFQNAANKQRVETTTEVMNHPVKRVLQNAMAGVMSILPESIQRKAAMPGSISDQVLTGQLDPENAGEQIGRMSGESLGTLGSFIVGNYAAATALMKIPAFVEFATTYPKLAAVATSSVGFAGGGAVTDILSGKSLRETVKDVPGNLVQGAAFGVGEFTSYKAALPLVAATTFGSEYLTGASVTDAAISAAINVLFMGAGKYLAVTPVLTGARATLGVSERATPEEIKAAYRSKSHELNNRSQAYGYKPTPAESAEAAKLNLAYEFLTSGKEEQQSLMAEARKFYESWKTKQPAASVEAQKLLTTPNGFPTGETAITSGLLPSVPKPPLPAGFPTASPLPPTIDNKIKTPGASNAQNGVLLRPSENQTPTPGSVSFDNALSELTRIAKGNVSDPVSDGAKLAIMNIGIINKGIDTPLLLNKKNYDLILAKRQGVLDHNNLVDTALNYTQGFFIQKNLEPDKIDLVKQNTDGSLFVIGANRFNGYGVITYFEQIDARKAKNYLDSLQERGESFTKSGGTASGLTTVPHPSSITPEGGVPASLSGVKPDGTTLSQEQGNVNTFQGFDDITTNILDRLKGKTTTSKQEILDFTRMADIKDAERNIVLAVLKGMTDPVNVQDFANKVKTELLPLEMKSSNKNPGIEDYNPGGYEGTTLPDELRGNVANYEERVYESPIKTSAGDVHPGLPKSEGYFAHTRVEDMADVKPTISPFGETGGTKGGSPNSTRRVIELQSDLFQKGRLEGSIETSTPKIEAEFKKAGGINAQDSLAKLEPYRNTWHERVIREEVKQAAIDGKTKLQFPTGETAMKIEGLGESKQWYTTPPGGARDTLLKESHLKVGRTIHNVTGNDSAWIITDVLGDGKFKAVPKSFYDEYTAGEKRSIGEFIEQLKKNDPNLQESFDISGKVDTNNPIYKFYESTVGKYLKTNYQATKVTDAQGVAWWQAEVKPEMAKGAINAFSPTPQPTNQFFAEPKVKPKRIKILPEETADPLTTEALKYKSADEFVKGYEPIFRGTQKGITEFKTSGEGRYANEGFFSVSTDKNVAKKYGSNVLEGYISKDANIEDIGDETGLKPNITDLRAWKKEGVDGVTFLNEDFERETIIFKPEIIKTKSQLTDIYNKAQETSPEPEGTTTLSMELIPGLSKTIEEDIVPKTKGFINSTKEMYDWITTLFNPVGKAPTGAVDILMTRKGAMEQEMFRAERATREIRKMWDKQPEKARLEFMQKVETGQPVEPEFHEIAEMYRERLDNSYKAIEVYKDLPFLENFFPHFWKKPDGFVSDFMAKRPLSGPKSFLKHRIFETIQEGMEAGFVPSTTNPEELMQIYEQNVRKFVMAQLIKDDMLSRGFWQFIRTGQRAPSSFARIDDPIARIYFPQKLASGREITTPAGEYWAQKDVARLINNYLSKDWIRDTPLGKGLMQTKNTLNAFQLGFSAFHFTMETIDTVVSKFSIGVTKLVTGHPIQGIKDIVSSPITPITYFRAGQKFFNGDPELLKIENDLFTAGAKLAERQYYKNTVLENFTRNVREGNYIGALFRTPMAAVEAMMRPLFSYYIPRLKVGAFRDLFASELMRPYNVKRMEAGELTREELAASVWNNVENRMGELNYDNLFWNKNLQGALMLTFRAVGWNLGTVRELGGGIFQDTPNAIKGAIKGKGFDFTPKMSYTFSLFLVMGMIGALYQYLHTGKKPERFLDLYYPQNGETDQNGDPYRIAFPDYLKDLYQVTHHPIRTVGHKLAPELTMILSLMQNKDFYGDYIRNENANLPTQAKQIGAFLISQLAPFSVQNIRQQLKGGTGVVQIIEAFFGLTKAPSEIIQSDRTKEIYKLLREQIGERGPQTPEQKEITNLKAQARLELQRGDETTLNLLKKMGVIKPGASEKAFRKAAELTPAERANRSLPKVKRVNPQNITDNQLYPEVTDSGSIKATEDAALEIFSDSARWTIGQAKIGKLDSEIQQNVAGEFRGKGTDFQKFVVKHIGPFSQKASDFIVKNTKFLQNLDKANIDIKTTDPEILAHEMLHQVFDLSPMSETNPDLSKNENAGTFGNQFLTRWDEVAGRDVDSPLQRIDDHINRDYDTENMAGSEIATEKFAYLGELVTKYGTSIIPKELRPFYINIFKFKK